MQGGASEPSRGFKFSNHDEHIYFQVLNRLDSDLGTRRLGGAWSKCTYRLCTEDCYCRCPKTHKNPSTRCAVRVSQRDYPRIRSCHTMAQEVSVVKVSLPRGIVMRSFSFAYDYNPDVAGPIVSIVCPST